MKEAFSQYCNAGDTYDTKYLEEEGRKIYRKQEHERNDRGEYEMIGEYKGVKTRSRSQRKNRMDRLHADLLTHTMGAANTGDRLSNKVETT